VGWMTKVQFLAGAGHVCLYHHVQTTSVAYPASYPVGIRTLSPGVRQAWHKGDHSTPSSAEVKLALPHASSWPGA